MPCTLWWAWHCRRRRSNSCLVSTWPVSRMKGKLPPKYSILYLYQLLKKCCCRELGGTETNVSSHRWELQQGFWQEEYDDFGRQGLTFSQRMSPIIDWLCTVPLLILMDFISLVLVMMRSFQLMKRIESSCLLNTLAALIGRMNTLK